MSADNGIYILKTRIPTGDVFDYEADRIIRDFEYRVAHAQAIDNLYYNVAKGEYQSDFTPEEAYCYFGNSEVFFTEREAWAAAREMAKNYDLLEYGVCLLSHGKQVFQTFSKEELARYDRRNEEANAAYRERRTQEQQSKIEAATIPFGEGMRFEPTSIRGYLVREDGTKVHGSLSGIEYLNVTEEVGRGIEGFDAGLGGEGFNLYFLPNDWDKK